MKLAMIGHKRIPSRAGGIEIVVEELAVRMAQRGHQVDVYNRNTGQPKQNKYRGVRLIEVPTFQKQSLNAMVYSVLATLRALFGRYDAIHFHAEGPCAMLWLARLFRIRTVATIHGLDWKRAKWGGFATKYLLFGEKMAAKYADELIVLSENMQTYFRDTYGRETRVIPNGMPAAAFRKANQIEKQFGLRPNEYILFLARITPEKGLDYLLDAFRQLPTRKKLVIAGGLEPETSYIQTVKKRAAQDDRVILADFVEGELLEELFSNCFLYVLPSDVEGMPISLLEAIRFRARCVASDIPENSQIARGYLHLFEYGNADSLHDALKTCLENEALRPQNFDASQSPEEIERQLDAIIAAYDWEKITDETLALYQKRGNKF